MGINVIIDSSLEGWEIKRTLEESIELCNIQLPFTIRWGNWIDEEDNGLVLNKPFAIKNSLDKENVILTLMRSKIRSPGRIKPGKKTDFPILGRKYDHSNGTDICIIDSLDEYKSCDSDYFQCYLKITHEYRVHIMDLNVFYIEEKYNTKISEEEDYEPIIRTKAFGWNLRKTDLSHIKEDTKEVIYNLSKKAVYSLGLDFGVVSIARAINGRYYILDVDSTCRWMSQDCKDAYVKQFIKTILKYNDLLGNNEDITIGADPECMLKDINNGDMVYASDFFDFNGLCGLDARSIEAGKEYFPLLEIRPDYSTNPLEVFTSIKNILTNIYTNIHYKNIGLFAGSMQIYNYWLGGHIHFGTKPNSKLIKALDNYLALPLMMIENPYSARHRRKTYGVLGNFRLKSHGGFEYCTLSSWLVSPKVASAVLCLAKVIVQEYLNLDKEFLSTYSDVRSYYLVNKNYFKDHIHEIIASIKDTKSYKHYSSFIEPLFNYILQSQEWNENRNMKETWELSSSNIVYSLPSRCFIPKSTREKLDIDLGEKIDLQLRGKRYSIEVYPKDDLTSEKSGYVSLSKDICKDIGIKESDTLGLYYDNKSMAYNIGPIFGIFAYRESHYMGPFALQSYFFRKLIKLSKNKGMITYVFTIWDIDWELNTVKGYSYDFENDEWIRKYFPLPDVIYDRGDVISEDNYGQYAIEYLENIENNNIKLINSIECISITNNKWATYSLLNSNSLTKDYQPITIPYDHPKSLVEFIKKYKHVFLKIKDGSRSKGIFSIEKINENHYSIQYKNLYGYNIILSSTKDNLIELIDKKIKEMEFQRSDYIIQRAIKLSKYKNQSFEIRVVMQKNSRGIWLRTCMVSRVVTSKERFLDVWNEDNIKASEVLKECFGDDSERITNRIRTIASKVVEVIDKNNIEAGELSIDFGIDIDMNVFIIELNSKPDNLLARIGAFKMRDLAFNRLLEYGKLLVLDDLNEREH